MLLRLTTVDMPILLFQSFIHLRITLRIILRHNRDMKFVYTHVLFPSRFALGKYENMNLIWVIYSFAPDRSWAVDPVGRAVRAVRIKFSDTTGPCVVFREDRNGRTSRSAPR